MEQARPRRGFFLTGNVLAGVLSCIFVGIFVLSTYQFDFWNVYFFRGTADAAAECTVAVRRGDGPLGLDAMRAAPASPVSVPHVRDLLATRAEGDVGQPYVTALYRCPVTMKGLGKEEGVVNLHTGWVVGDRSEIFVNGSSRASFLRLGKAAVPLRLEDVHGDVETGRLLVEILATAPRGDGFGLIGLSPMVLAKGASLNARVLGVDFAIANQKMLYTLLPLLTLGLTLVFGWVIGIRTRMMTVTLFFLTLSALRNVVTMLADFWPWPFEVSFWLQDVVQQGSIFAFILFGAEMLGLFREWILRLMAAVTVAVAIAAAVTIATVPGFPAVRTGVFVAAILQSILMLTVIARGLWHGARVKGNSPSEQAARRTHKWTVGLVGVQLLSIWSDVLLGDVFRTNFRLSPQVEKILPLFVAAILFYTLYLIEQALREERETRAKMETELEVAAKLQGVLLPADREGLAHGFHYEIESKPFGILGGDWVRVHRGSRASLFVLGDVVGKGPSAALTHSGIAASWASQIKLWERGAVTTQELLTAINSTMHDLYQGTMNSTFAFAEVTTDGKARLAAGGNHWLHLNPKKSVAVTLGGRALLGLQADFAVQIREVALEKGDWLVCFTDGVLEGGRPISRFIRAVQGEIGAGLDGAKIRDMLVAAGRDEVHPDDASMLLLRFDGAEEAKVSA